MKNIALSTLLLALSVGTTACGAPAPISKPISATSLPALKVIAHSDEQLTLALTNDTQRDFHFSGYSLGSPLYSMETKGEQDWTADMVGWCGTGVAEQCLEAGKETTFTVYLSSDATRRVLVALKDEDGKRVTIKSAAFSR